MCSKICLPLPKRLRGRTFHFTFAQTTPSHGRRGVGAMSCMDEVPRKRGDGVPDQGSQDAHTLKTTPETGFTQIGGAPVRRKKKKKKERKTQTKTTNKTKTRKTPHSNKQKTPNPSSKAATGATLQNCFLFPVALKKNKHCLASSCQMPHSQHPNK